MKHTDLSKKDLGRKRYERHHAFVGAKLARAGRTNASDIAPVRITDGRPLVLTKQVFSHSSKSLSWMDLLMAKLSHGKKKEAEGDGFEAEFQAKFEAELEARLV